jgi:hypothetical protein
MERSADRTFALVLWAKHAHHVFKGFMLLTLISWALRSLVRNLSPGKLEHLTQQQAIDLTKRTQEIHDLLLEICRSADMRHMHEHRIFGPAICSLQESCEDLGDIIEDLILSENEQFRNLVATCAQSLSKPELTGSRGRM